MEYIFIFLSCFVVKTLSSHPIKKKLTNKRLRLAIRKLVFLCLKPGTFMWFYFWFYVLSNWKESVFFKNLGFTPRRTPSPRIPLQLERREYTSRNYVKPEPSENAAIVFFTPEIHLDKSNSSQKSAAIRSMCLFCQIVAVCSWNVLWKDIEMVISLWQTSSR